MIRRIDIDVLSTATTMSRRPGFISGPAWCNGHAWDTFSGASGQFSCTSSDGVGLAVWQLSTQTPIAARRPFFR
jgi:hypothetical protein